MNAFAIWNSVSANNFSDSLVIWCLNVMLQATLVAALVLILSTWFRRSPVVRYGVLCCGLLLTLICPLSVCGLQVAGVGLLTVSLKSTDLPLPTIADASPIVPSVSFSDLTASIPTVKLPSSIPTDTFSNNDVGTESSRLGFADSDLYNSYSDSLQSASSLSKTNPNAAIENVVAEATLLEVETVSGWSLSSWARTLIPPLLMLWLTVAGLLLVRLTVGWMRVLRLLRKSECTTDEYLLQAFRRACFALDIPEPIAELRISPRLDGPIAVGLLHPTVVLPEQLSTQITDRQLHEILVHELAHIVRHDQIVVLLQNITQALFWMHPLVRGLNRQLAQAREEVCDNYVLSASDAPTYSRTLLTIAEIARPRRPLPGTVGLFTSRWKLESRIAGLLDARRSRMTRLTTRGIALVALMAVGLIGMTSLATLSLSVAEANGTDEPDGPNSETQPTTELILPETISVKGKVLLPDGSPATGALVRAQTPVWASLKDLLGVEVQSAISETKTDSSGQFEIEFSTKPFGDLSGLDPFWDNIWKKTTIATLHEGYGPDWIEYESIPIDARSNLTLQLVEDQPIHGRVLDLEGRPLSNVPVAIGGLRAGENNEIRGWLEAVNNGEAWTVYRHVPKNIDLTLVDIVSELTTDAQGAFVIRGLGKDRIISVQFESESVANETVTVINRQMRATTRVLDENGEGAKEQVFGATFDFTAAPARVIEGVVIDAETKAPLVDVTVESYKLANHFFVGGRELSTRTDEKGRFRLIGMAKGDGNILMIRPNDQQPYLMRRVAVPNPAGVGPIDVVAEIHRGIWITGKIVDRVTREPVSAARVYYLPYLSNEAAQALPEFDENGNVDGDQERYQTDRNGEFRLVGLPGPAIVGARSVLKTYRHGSGYEQLAGPKHETEEHALTWRNPIWVGPKWPDIMREINPSEDEAVLSLDLEMDPGESVPITVVDQAGEPVTGAKLRGLLETNGSTVETQSKEYAVVNLGPDEERVITVHHEARNIGLVATISSMDEAPRRIELLPCARISGKLTKDGVPLPGLSIRATILPGGDFAPVLDRQFITDIDGHFADVLLPGCNYSLGAVGQGLDHYATVVADLTIEPGQSIALGTLELSDDQKFLSVAKSSAQSDSLAERVYVAGKVLDQAGKPIENATVFVGFPKSEGKDRGVRASAPIKTISDKDGTFTTSYVLGELFEGADQISRGAWQQIPQEIYVAALSDGMSPDWRTLSDIAAGEPLTLQLAASRSLVGRLITLEGNAVPGANVRLKSIASAMNQNIELWLASLRDGEEIGQASREHQLRYLRPELLDRQTEFTTDALGRFEIPNIGQDQVATLVVTAPGIARQVIRMIARELEPMSTNSVANHLESTMLYGEEASAIVVAPSQAIVGIVRDATTKEPLAGVAVDSARIAGSNSIGSRTEIVSSVTDENGRYQLEGLPKGKGNVVLAVPNDDQPYFMREVPVPIEDGMQPITLDIELSRGFWLTGKVVDSESGEPVTSSLKYFPFLDNKSANVALGFTGSGFMDACFSYQARYQTRSDGSFRIVVLPGRAIVGAETYGGSSASYQKGIGSQNISGLNDDGTFATYRNPFVASNKFPNVMVEVDVPETGDVADILLKAVPGVPVNVRIADGNGKPVTGFDVNGISFSSQWNRKLEISEFEVTGLGPHDSRTILILHEELGIGKAFRITPELDRTQVVDIRLEPLIAVCGHIVDENDAPISNAQMSALTQPLEDYNPQLDAVTTDYDGRFQFTSIPAGVAYRIEGWTHGKSLKQFQQIDFEAQAGQEIDVGSYRADADGELMSLGAQP